MRIITEPKLDFADVLICPKRSTLGSRNEVDLTRKFIFKNSNKAFAGVPIIASNMLGVGTFTMAHALWKHDQMMTALHKRYIYTHYADFFNESYDNRWKAFYSMGITEEDLKKYHMVHDAGNLKPQYVCIDVANGYSQKFLDFVRRFRDDNKDVALMAGNVVTGEMVEELILSGVDIVKIGIGPGSVCTTRKVTGVGYPQLSAIIECADAAHGLGGHICADGGITCPGDLVKAFGAGADFVMMGGALAAHNEGEVPNEVGPSEGKVVFFGMSSDDAMGDDKHSYRAAEGKAVVLDHRGPVSATIQEYLGGLRSACTYVGAKSLRELSKCTTFIMVNRQLNEVYSK